MSWEGATEPDRLACGLSHPGSEIGRKHLSQVTNKH
jgi:hypothetical protein